MLKILSERTSANVMMDSPVMVLIDVLTRMNVHLVKIYVQKMLHALTLLVVSIVNVKLVSITLNLIRLNFVLILMNVRIPLLIHVGIMTGKGDHI